MDLRFTEAERSFRDLKTTLELRPVFHRLEHRIRAHVIVCWLALLLIRIAETTCGATWPALRRELDRIHVGTFTGPAGTFRPRTEITKPQRDILAQFKIDPPPRIYQLTPAEAFAAHPNYPACPRSPRGHARSARSAWRPPGPAAPRPS